MTSKKIPEPKNIEASVRARLQNKAQETGRPFAEVFQYYGMERFLYRLSQSKYADTFVLKGALMFVVWKVPGMRTTRDIDFLGRFDNEIVAIESVFREICSMEGPQDGLFFDPETVKGERIKEDADYEGVRIKFTGFLGKARIPMQVDIGFGDVVFPKPKTINYPAILDFPSAYLKGYAAETVVAEKFEAMIKLGHLNSRMKDFYDIWLMARQFRFSGEELTQAIRRTFEHRGTGLPGKMPFFDAEIYDNSSDRQQLWKAFLRKMEIKNAPGELCEIARGIESFLLEPVKAIHSSRDFTAHWHAPGPWH
ncbi:MAG: nucleotidyl transferase AbiEii/AbiGii toxin family protein [Candidatus Omnitrophota bacterium]